MFSYVDPGSKQRMIRYLISIKLLIFFSHRYNRKIEKSKLVERMFQSKYLRSKKKKEGKEDKESSKFTRIYAKICKIFQTKCSSRLIIKRRIKFIFNLQFLLRL